MERRCKQRENGLLNEARKRKRISARHLLFLFMIVRVEKGSESKGYNIKDRILTKDQMVS